MEMLVWAQDRESHDNPRYDYEPSYDEAPAPEDESSTL